MSAETPHAAPSASADARLEVVVVDDCEDNAEMLGALLEEYGHHVRIAGDGTRALNLLEQRLPDLVFLDLELPDIEGFDVSIQMRERFGTGFWVVAFTGHSGSSVRARARECGIDAFIAKPIGVTDLEALLHTTLLNRTPGQLG